MSGIHDSARKHCTEHCIQVVGLIIIIAACAVALVAIVVRFRLGLQ